MIVFDNPTPVVLCFSSHDPTGGAGIQADIETAVSLGCHCAPVITAIAVRDTREYKDMASTDTSLLIEQARAILEDMPVAAIKIGLAGSVANIQAIHSILIDYPEIPLVLDPVAQIGASPQAESNDLYAAISNWLLPLATVATPSFFEAHQLAREADNVDACAHEILESGCQYVLISDNIGRSDTLCNTLYDEHRLIRRYEWPRISQACHGSGATLASSIACYLAHGLGIFDAVEQGQKFTWQSLNQARRLGMGKYIPNRFHWIADAMSAQPRITH